MIDSPWTSVKWCFHFSSDIISIAAQALGADSYQMGVDIFDDYPEDPDNTKIETKYFICEIKMMIDLKSTHGHCLNVNRPKLTAPVKKRK